MLLSFSVLSMLPMLKAGILEHKSGRAWLAGPRVKRQTIRARGPRAEKLLAQAKDGKHPGTLHLWWKSRTKMREPIGDVEGFEIYPIEITRGSAGACFITGKFPMSWDRTSGGHLFKSFALADGFDSSHEFIEYFVPNVGDTFSGVLFKW